MKISIQHFFSWLIVKLWIEEDIPISSFPKGNQGFPFAEMGFPISILPMLF
jgi:hypothetical protein